jgi:hypothetical protein
LGTTDSRTLRELEDMNFTWYEKDTDNAVAMAADVGLELSFTEVVRRHMREINVDNVAQLLEGRGIVKLTGDLMTPGEKPAA